MLVKLTLIPLIKLIFWILDGLWVGRIRMMFFHADSADQADLFCVAFLLME